MSRIDTLRALHEAVDMYASPRSKVGYEFYWAARNAMPDLLALAEAAQGALAWLDEHKPKGGGIVREALREALARLEGR